MKSLIIVCGLPGAGKSTLSEGIARELRLPVFSVDPIESSIVKAGVNRSFETGLAAYLITETMARENLSLGNSLVIDSVSAVKEAKQMWHELSANSHAKLIIIECICSDEEIHKKRIEARVRNLHGIPEVTWNDVLKRKEEYIAWDVPVLSIDSINDPRSNLNTALSYIAGQ